jgi:hypothetical protein
MGFRLIAAYEAKASRGLKVPFQNAGAPTTTTQLGRAVVGSELTDYTNGIDYVCTATDGTTTVTWTKVGLQT